MLYSSLNGDVRQTHMEDFFATYYSSYASVLASDKQPAKFTFSQLKENFYQKNNFGLIAAMSLIPILLAESSDIPDLSEFKFDNMEKAQEEFKAIFGEIVQKNPLLKTRFLCLLDEMKVSGIFDSVLNWILSSTRWKFSIWTIVGISKWDGFYYYFLWWLIHWS